MAHRHTLDHMQVEPKSEVQEEQVLDVFKVSQVMDTNIFPKEGKPWCITTNAPCLLISNHYLLFYFLLHIKFIGVI
jgi:hypothetical protein